MRHLTVLLLIAIAPFVKADDTPLVELKVRPVLCITDERTPSCEMSFIVVWQSEQTGYYCLYNDFQDSPIECWTNEQSGETDDDRTVHTEFSYRMTGDDNETLLAEVAVEVLRMDTGDRRRKRRSRHVWDLL